MESYEQNARNLEQLLETLIKMVGKANQKISSLQIRVNQLEWLFKEQQLATRNRSPAGIYQGSQQEQPEELSLQL